MTLSEPHSAKRRQKQLRINTSKQPPLKLSKFEDSRSNQEHQQENEKKIREQKKKDDARCIESDERDEKR